jgi:hypothetical protein
VPVLNVSYSGTNFNDVIGIKSKCKPADYYGIGGSFEGGYIGIDSKVEGNTAPSEFFLAYAMCHRSRIRQLLWNIFKSNQHQESMSECLWLASSGTTNWAGYFEGNVFIRTAWELIMKTFILYI